MIQGRWYCQTVLFGTPLLGTETYTDTNYTSIFTSQGWNGYIIVGGGYSAAAVGPRALRISYQPSDWSPKEICSGPFGHGGNCLILNFPPETHVATFANANSFERDRAGGAVDTCQRQ